MCARVHAFVCVVCILKAVFVFVANGGPLSTQTSESGWALGQTLGRLEALLCGRPSSNEKDDFAITLLFPFFVVLQTARFGRDSFLKRTHFVSGV